MSYFRFSPEIFRLFIDQDQRPDLQRTKGLQK